MKNKINSPQIWHLLFFKIVLDTNIHNLSGTIFQVAIFLFDYMGIAYFRSNDVPPPPIKHGKRLWSLSYCTCDTPRDVKEEKENNGEIDICWL